jgi:hypothetical protein
MFYKFYHHGKLGDSPNVPKGIEVNTCVIRFIIVFFHLTDKCLDVLHVGQKAWKVIYDVSHDKTLQLARGVKLGNMCGSKRL